MNNTDKLKQIFSDVFGVEPINIDDSFCKEKVDNWDSVHQLGIIAGMEDTFDLMLDPEEIIACTSFIAAKNILDKYEA